MAKQKKSNPNALINLRAKDSGKEKQFDIKHALALLRLPNSQWEVQDEQYTFDNNDIKRRPSSEENN